MENQISAQDLANRLRREKFLKRNQGLNVHAKEFVPQALRDLSQASSNVQSYTSEIEVKFSCLIIDYYHAWAPGGVCYGVYPLKAKKLTLQVYRPRNQ